MLITCYRVVASHRKTVMRSNTYGHRDIRNLRLGLAWLILRRRFLNGGRLWFFVDSYFRPSSPELRQPFAIMLLIVTERALLSDSISSITVEQSVGGTSGRRLVDPLDVEDLTLIKFGEWSGRWHDWGLRRYYALRLGRRMINWHGFWLGWLVIRVIIRFESSGNGILWRSRRLGNLWLIQQLYRALLNNFLLFALF